jgi:hypothetical protein
MAAVLAENALASLLDQGGNDILDETGSGSGWLFTGPETLVYPGYIDLGAQHTLVAVPGGTYQIIPAGQGDPVIDANNPVPPADGLWEAN